MRHLITKPLAALPLAIALLIAFSGVAVAGDKLDGKVPTPKSLPPEPPAKITPLDKQALDDARHEVLGALQSKDRFIRAHAIACAQEVLPSEAQASFVAALSDSEPVVRFSAAMAIGQLRLKEAKESVLKLLDDNDPSVRIGVRFALHRLGDTRFSHDFEKFSRDPLAGVRSNTAVALGLLGEPTAVRVLRPMQQDTSPAVRLQVAEALWRLGEKDGLTTLVAASLSAYADDQMIAYPALAGPRNSEVRQHVRVGLLADHIEVNLAAARAMGELDSDQGYSIARGAMKSTDPRIRSLACLALGAIGRSDSQDVLITAMHDKESTEVRLCAAFALLQLKSDR